MNKFFFTLLCCVLAISSANGKVGRTFDQGILRYTILTETGTTGTVSVGSTSNYNTGTLTIPQQVTNNNIRYTVTKIADNGFLGCRDLTGSLKIPSTVTSIGSGAFEDCRNLTGDIVIPNGVTSIGDNAFSMCRGFNGKLSIPNTVTSIGAFAFYECSGLTGDLVIPNSVTSLGDHAFYYCDDAFKGCKLTLSNKLKKIGAQTFAHSTGWSGNIVIPEGVTTIDWDAFSGCTGFNGTLTIPSTMVSIGTNAFRNCSGLTGNLVIPNSVTSIGDGAFQGCKSFNGTLTIPSSLTSISTSTFDGCSGLTGNLVIPNSVTSIGDGAFQGCKSFNGTLTIPSSLTSISTSTFDGCSGLTGNLVIPNSVTSIGNSAFDGCKNLFSVLIPNSVTSIGKNAFAYCDSLKHLTIPSTLSGINFNIQSSSAEMTIPAMDDVSKISNQTVKSIFFLSENLPSSENFLKYPSITNFYLKPSVYERNKDKSEWTKLYHLTDSIPVSFSVGKRFVTMCRDFDVDFRHTNDNLPSGVSPLKAYIVSDVDERNNAIILQEIKYVPSRLRSNEKNFTGYDKYIGVLLKGTPGYTYYYTIGEDDYTRGVDGQMTLEKALALSNASVPTSLATLVGANDPKHITTEETVDGITYKTYGLKNNEFCRYSADGYVPYNKAYLRIPATYSPAAKESVTLIFRDADGTTTSISSDSLPKTKYGQDFIFDLQGMKIAHPIKGKVYIQNGKKYLQK
jgi:hypothetical protein